MDLTDDHDPHAGSDRDTLRHLAYVIGGLIVVSLALIGVVAIVV